MARPRVTGIKKEKYTLYITPFYLNKLAKKAKSLNIGLQKFTREILIKEVEKE